MFAVIINPKPLPVEADDERRGYDIGFGRGTMDKCSGEPARALDNIADTDYNFGYANGYIDGYSSNEARM